MADLVTGGISETGEEREELAGEGKVGGVLEDDLVKSAGIGNLGLVAHQPLRDGVDLETNAPRSVYAGDGVTRASSHTGWKTASSAIPAEPGELSQFICLVVISAPGVSGGREHTGTENTGSRGLLLVSRARRRHFCG